LLIAGSDIGDFPFLDKPSHAAAMLGSFRQGRGQQIENGETPD